MNRIRGGYSMHIGFRLCIASRARVRFRARAHSTVYAPARKKTNSVSPLCYFYFSTIVAFQTFVYWNATAVINRLEFILHGKRILLSRPSAGEQDRVGALARSREGL